MLAVGATIRQRLGIPSDLQEAAGESVSRKLSPSGYLTACKGLLNSEEMFLAR